MKSILEQFEARTNAELHLAMEEIKWLNDCVARGLMKAEHAQGRLATEKYIVATKLRVLGLG